MQKLSPECLIKWSWRQLSWLTKKKKKKMRKASPILNPHGPRQLVHTYTQQEKTLGKKWVDSRTLDLRLRIPPQAQGHPFYMCGPEKILASWNGQLTLL